MDHRPPALPWLAALHLCLVLVTLLIRSPRLPNLSPHLPCTPSDTQVYQDLVKKHPTFRERSERVDLSVRAADAWGPRASWVICSTLLTRRQGASAGSLCT